MLVQQAELPYNLACRAPIKENKGMRTTMPEQTLRAIQVHRHGGSEELKLKEKPRPQPSAGEVLLRVHAAGVNPIGWKIRQGLPKNFQPILFPSTPGIEVAGVIEEIGPGVTTFKVGQAVPGQVTIGAYAEYLSISVEALALKPERLSFVEAASIPVGATTAWRVLSDHRNLMAGQWVLIIGDAGGGTRNNGGFLNERRA
ncbi:MAG TPA: NADP-dependent oxidoreductase [Ktedonobacteraceae bacterium]|nr:NADP-dependent oxidoreductase [Ktedonobacteraceae bacterium]